MVVSYFGVIRLPEMPMIVSARALIVVSSVEPRLTVRFPLVSTYSSSLNRPSRKSSM